MKARCLLPDRRVLIKALESNLDIKAKYQGAPTFSYIVGPYTVQKDGTLVADDADVDQALIIELATKDMIYPDDYDLGCTVISIPIDRCDGKTLMNIVFRLNSKDEIISKAVGLKGAFRISEKFVSALDKSRPTTTEEFLDILAKTGGNKINTGIEFNEEKVLFLGFPYTDSAKAIEAYTTLVEKIVKEAEEKHRIRPERTGLPENEKFAFRNWLAGIGMRGDEYKASRKILLRNLKGISGFKTRAQAEAAAEKWSEIRRERREQKCNEFHVL